MKYMSKTKKATNMWVERKKRPAKLWIMICKAVKKTQRQRSNGSSRSPQNCHGPEPTEEAINWLFNLFLIRFRSRSSKIILRLKVLPWLAKPKKKNEKTWLNLRCLPTFSSLIRRSKIIINLCQLTRSNQPKSQSTDFFIFLDEFNKLLK